MKKWGALIALSGLLLSATRTSAAAPEACSGKGPATEQTFSGTFDESLEGSHVLIGFDVPEGTTEIWLRICYDQPPTPASSQIKHTLDLGLYEPTGDGLYDTEEFRGWGGSSRPTVHISPDDSTVGYLPGPIPAGRWAAEIGVAAVAGLAEGDPDGAVAWRLEVAHTSDPADADQPWQPAPYDETPARTQAGWYMGDFHVHAEHSNPNDAPMKEVFDHAFGPHPAGAGLDFITLSDYVTTRHWQEIGRFQHLYPGKLIARSAEVITYRGHINNHGSATYVDHRTGPIYELQGNELVPIREAQPASRIIDDIRAAGGYAQINHPTTFPAAVPGFSNLCRGCSWEYSDEETDWSKVDSIEITTGPGGTSEPRQHELGPNPFSPLAIRWWDDLLNRGYDITAVGSSDSHNAGGGNGITQSPIGEGTTVVYAEELSEEGIQRAVEQGHAYVKFFSPQGPDLRFEAVAGESPGKGKGKGRPKAIMGDSLRTSSATFEAKVLGGGPNPEPRTLIVMRNGAPYLAVPVTSADFTYTFSVDEPGIYRLQLQRLSAIEALTNPITLFPNKN
ncbi:MAG: CehA/McbA family metallohydrolase [Actinomycetota bacterium]